MGVLPHSRDTVDVFYSPSRLDWTLLMKGWQDWRLQDTSILRKWMQFLKGITLRFWWLGIPYEIGNNAPKNCIWNRLLIRFYWRIQRVYMVPSIDLERCNEKSDNWVNLKYTYEGIFIYIYMYLYIYIYTYIYIYISTYVCISIYIYMYLYIYIYKVRWVNYHLNNAKMEVILTSHFIRYSY